MTRAHALLALPAAFLLLGATGAPPLAEVTVAITGLRNAKGLVRACMTAEPKSFPECRGDDRAYRATVDAETGAIALHFEGVAPGRYAVALLHDENANGKADLVLGMMPKEGFGFSRDAKVRMGPPRFEDAAVDIGASDRQIAIRMRYLL